jgi:uncharacterized protein DUF4956
MNTPHYGDLAMRLGMDVAAVFLFAYAIYYRRHHRRDLLTAYTVFNVGLFVVVAVITVRPVGAAVGFGLFALLSIIRLRSDTFTNLEITYFFVALVIGLVNGLPVGHLDIVGGLDSVVLATVFLVDHPRLLSADSQRAFRTEQVVLDTIHPDEGALRADLERRLGVEIHSLTVCQIDYVRDVTVVSIQHRPRRAAAAVPGLAEPPEVDANRNGGAHAM